MSDREEENLRNGILRLKAQLAYKESIPSRPPITKNSWGRPVQESQGSRIRLHEECQHLQRRIDEFETQILLWQYQRSIDPLTRNAVAQTAIEKKLAERGIYLRIRT